SQRPDRPVRYRCAVCALPERLRTGRAGRRERREPAVKNPFAGREIWFLTGSQGLYGPETLDQVAAQSQEVARTLDDADQIPVRIVTKPLLTDAASIRRIALEANADDSCIGVLTWM